jgi:CheY-like chemotaxis protein
MILQGKNIFIVEDNQQNRVVFQMSLIRHGATVEFERCGRDTVYALSGKLHIDLICLDLMLAHNVSGFDLFQQIRAIPSYNNIPIVAVSAMDPAIAVPKVRALGFSGFIAKPINNQLFPKQLAKLLAGESVWHMGEQGAQVSI